MTHVIDDPRSSTDAPEAPPQPPRARSVRPSVLAALVLALAVVAVLALRSTSDHGRPAPATFAPGTTITIDLRCSTGQAACIAGTTGPDGGQWIWTTVPGASVPPSWLDHEVHGQLQVDSEWGPSPFTSGGETVTLQGGRSTPEHSLYR